MSITPLPSAPQPTDSTAEFNTKAFAWVASLDTFVTETNALASDVSNDADTASAAATDAESAAASAIAAAGVVKWVSGTTYDEGDVVWSPINYLSYRRKTTGGGTTDPSIDTTNWVQVAGTGNVTLDGIQTMTNKTITALKGTKIAMSGNDIDLSAGDAFTKTISATTTFTVSNIPASGKFCGFFLELTNAGSQTINWSTSFGGSNLIKWAGGTAPTLTASGRDLLGFLWDGGTTWTGLVLGKDIK